MRESLPCIACGRTLRQVFDDAPENQPSCGTEFRTHGHYGSTTADFMDGHYLVVNICDLCLISHHDRVLKGRDMEPIIDKEGVMRGWSNIDWKPVKWNPSESEIEHAIEQSRDEFELHGLEVETDAEA